MNAAYSKECLDLMAKEGNAKDIELMNRVVEFLEDVYGMEAVMENTECNVIMGCSGYTIAEIKEAYRTAKKAVKPI